MLKYNSACLLSVASGYWQVPDRPDFDCLRHSVRPDRRIEHLQRFPPLPQWLVLLSKDAQVWACLEGGSTKALSKACATAYSTRLLSS